MTHYPDNIFVGNAEVLANDQLAKDQFCIRLANTEIGTKFAPGQFAMLRVPGSDPLLGRPLAVYRVTEEAIEFVYLVVGKGTAKLRDVKPGETLELWGPLGNGFAPVEADHLIVVAGGIGFTPFLTLLQETLGVQDFGRQVQTEKKKATMLYGVASKCCFAGLDELRGTGVDLRLATDDGSEGHHGFVTELLAELLEETAGESRLVVGCGPHAMLASMVKLASASGVPSQVSLEEAMACGVGICYSCIAKIKTCDCDEGECDYQRTCVEGPIFDGETVQF